MEGYVGRASLVLLGVVVVVGGVVVAARWAARHPERVRTAVEHRLDRPWVRRLVASHRAQLDFLARRLRPGGALGLSLTAGLVVLALAGAAFGKVAEDVAAREELARFDVPVGAYLAAHREAWLTTALRAVSTLGTSAVLVPVIVGVGVALRLARRRWTPFALLAGAYLGAAALYGTVKPLVERPRPALAPLVATASGYAFPSGHATQAVAVGGALAYVASGALRSWGAKVAAWTAAAVVALLVGVSRVYLGVHWATDVVGGYALGAAWLAVLVTTTTVVAERRPDAAGRS